MFYGVHSVITVVMSFILWQGCQVIASGFSKMSRCQSVKKKKHKKQQTENFILTVSILFKVHVASQNQHTGSYTGLQNKGKARVDAEV